MLRYKSRPTPKSKTAGETGRPDNHETKQPDGQADKDPNTQRTREPGTRTTTPPNRQRAKHTEKTHKQAHNPHTDNDAPAHILFIRHDLPVFVGSLGFRSATVNLGAS